MSSRQDRYEQLLNDALPGNTSLMLARMLVSDMSGLGSGRTTFVDESRGDDSDGEGTLFAPYATPQRAVDAIAERGDNSADNPDLVLIGLGSYPGVDVRALKHLTMTGLADPYLGLGVKLASFTCTQENDELRSLMVNQLTVDGPLTLEGASEGTGFGGNDLAFTHCLLRDVVAKNGICACFVRCKGATLLFENIDGNVDGSPGFTSSVIVRYDENEKKTNSWPSYCIIEDTIVANLLRVERSGSAVGGLCTMQGRRGTRFGYAGTPIVNEVGCQIYAGNCWFRSPIENEGDVKLYGSPCPEGITGGGTKLQVGCV